MSDGGQTVEPSNALVAARKRLSGFLQVRLPTLGEWAKGKVDPASLIRFAMVEWTQSVQLQRCSMDSIYLALVACAQVGLEPSGIKQEAFIVPFKGVATFMPGYRGLIKLARRSREVKAVRSHPVYERDVFEAEYGSDARVIHKPALRERGELIGAYALAKLDNGEVEVEWMAVEDLEKIRKSAKRGDTESPAYREWADQMYRKAPIRRLCKRLPLGDDYFRAARLDEALEGGDLQTYQAVIDIDSAPLVAEPQAQPAPEPAKGVAGAKQQLKKKRAEPEPPDVLEEEIATIKTSIERLHSNPQWVPGLRDRIARLPAGAEKVQLEQALIEAEQELEAARRQDDLPGM